MGSEVCFIRGEQANDPRELCSNYPKLIDELSIGDGIMLADGTISLTVTARTKDSVTCKVIVGGTIRSRQGINLPGVALTVSAMRPEDVDNALWAARNEIDFISLSFVGTTKDVSSLKNLLASMESNALVVAKIEKREALTQLEAIVDAADAVMVARGDLGVEIDVADTPVALKEDHSSLPRSSQTGDRCNANAREYAPQPKANSSRSNRCRQRNSGWRRHSC